MKRPSRICITNGGPHLAKVGVSLLLVFLILVPAVSPALAVLQQGEGAASVGESTTGRGQATFLTTVTKDGYVRASYDVFVWCGNVSAGVDEEYVRAEFEATLHAVEEGALEEAKALSEEELRVRLEEESTRQVEACREAGFPTADDSVMRDGSAFVPPEALPKTGGVPPVSLPATGMLLVVLATAYIRARRR